MLKPAKILVPTDFSKASDAALEQAIDIARHYNAELYVFHVIPMDLTHAFADYAIPVDAIDSFERLQIDGAFDSMKQQIAAFPKSKDLTVTMNIAKGVAYDEILKQAKQEGIDLIVIASLGKSGLAKYLIGSVARNVLKKAHCPVLLTR
ncbi:MAG: universal stress protein [Syntrophorhabdus sp.]